MTESAFNRPVPVQEQQAARTAEPTRIVPQSDDLIVVPPLQDRGHLSTHPNFPNGLEIPGVGTVPVHSTSEHTLLSVDEAASLEADAARVASDAELRHIMGGPDPGATTRDDYLGIDRDLVAEGDGPLPVHRYEGTVLGNPVVSDPTMQRTIIAAVHLTAEQIAATKHLKPGEAWAKAGQSLEPEPPAKVEDLDEF